MAREGRIGEGGESPVLFEFEALQRTVAFLATPHLLAVMGTIAGGRQPYTALPGVMPEQIDTAIERLLEVGIARLVVDGDHGSTDSGHTTCPVALTRKGWRVLELVYDLREAERDMPELADGERMPSRPNR